MNPVATYEGVIAQLSFGKGQRAVDLAIYFNSQTWVIYNYLEKAVKNGKAEKCNHLGSDLYFKKI